MYILPLVMSLMLILSLFSLYQFQSLSSSTMENKAHRAYLQALRLAHNDQADKLWKETKKSSKKNQPNPEPNESPPQPTSQNEEWVYFREKCVHSKGALNLYSLLSEENKLLLKIAQKYFLVLYKDVLKEHRDFCNQCLPYIIAKQKIQKTPLHEIQFKNPVNQALYYKILKGTCNHEGYPPLGRAFTFDENNKESPIFFKKAPEKLLKILLGERAAKAICAKEYEDQKNDENHSPKPLTKKDLVALLKKLHLYDLEDRLKLLSFENKAPPPCFTDKTTNITVVLEEPFLKIPQK